MKAHTAHAGKHRLNRADPEAAACLSALFLLAVQKNKQALVTFL